LKNINDIKGERELYLFLASSFGPEGPLRKFGNPRDYRRRALSALENSHILKRLKQLMKQPISEEEVFSESTIPGEIFLPRKIIVHFKSW
jgi:hypothetical protein